MLLPQQSFCFAHFVVVLLVLVQRIVQISSDHLSVSDFHVCRSDQCFGAERRRHVIRDVQPMGRHFVRQLSPIGVPRGVTFVHHNVITPGGRQKWVRVASACSSNNSRNVPIGGRRCDCVLPLGIFGICFLNFCFVWASVPPFGTLSPIFGTHLLFWHFFISRPISSPIFHLFVRCYPHGKAVAQCSNSPSLPALRPPSAVPPISNCSIGRRPSRAP